MRLFFLFFLWISFCLFSFSHAISFLLSFVVLSVGSVGTGDDACEDENVCYVWYMV